MQKPANGLGQIRYNLRSGHKNLHALISIAQAPIFYKKSILIHFTLVFLAHPLLKNLIIILLGHFSYFIDLWLITFFGQYMDIFSNLVSNHCYPPPQGIG